MKYLSLLILILCSTIVQGQWTQVNSGVTTNLNDITFSDNNTGHIVGDSGKVLNSTDGGNTWIDVSPSHSEDFSAIEFSTNDNGITSGEGTFNGPGNKTNKAFATSNGGISWEQGSNIQLNGEVRDIHFVDNKIGFAAGIYQGNPIICMTATCPIQEILRTEDGGGTWSILPIKVNVQGARAHFVHFIDSETGFAGGSKGRIVKTTNGGDAWTDMSPAGSGSHTFIKMQFIDMSIGFAISIKNDSGFVWKTNNQGINWSIIHQTKNKLSDLYFGNSFSGIIVGDTGLVQATFNGGTSWQSQILPDIGNANLKAITFRDDTTGFVIGDGGVLYTTNIDLEGSAGTPPLKATFNTSITDTVCTETPFTFFNASESATSFEWYVDDILVSTEINLIYAFPRENFGSSTTKTFEVKLVVDSANAKKDSTTQSYIATLKPSPDFMLSNDTILIDSTIDFSSIASNSNAFEWYVNDVKLSDSSDFSFVFEFEGTYEVRLKAFNNFCDSTSAIKTIDVFEELPTPGTGLYFSRANKISLWPNPNNGQFNISLANSNSRIKITDLQGRVVFDKLLPNKSESISTGLRNGLYILSIIENKNNIRIPLTITSK